MNTDPILYRHGGAREGRRLDVVNLLAVALAATAVGILAGACRPDPAATSGAAAGDAHGCQATETRECQDHCTEGTAAAAPRVADAHAGHAHGGAEEGHPEATESGADDPSPEALAAQDCEHGIRIADCAECRYEAGVVQLGDDVAKALVKTAPVERVAFPRSLRLTGEVALDDTAVVEVVPMASGTVTRVTVRLGQTVSAGEVLAVVHSSDVGEAKATYLEVLTAAEIATQERDRRRLVTASLTKLLAALPKGAAGVAAEAEPLGEWRSRLVGAAARLEQARAGFERESALVQKEASSRAELDAAQYEFRAAEADLAALVEEAQLSLEVEQLRADNAARQAEARRVAAEQRLHLLGLDQAAIERIREMNENGRFADLEIRAPRAGTVTALAMTPGRFVDASHSLCTIADLSTLWVWCDLYERDLAVLQECMDRQGKAEARVQVTAFPEAFPGVVDLIGHGVDEHTRTLKVRVLLTTAGGKVRPGMFATADIQLPTGRSASLVPRDAVLSDGGRSFVFQRWQDDLWLRRFVELGETAGDRVEILRGVEPGAQIVVSGGFMLKSDVLREKMGAGCAD